MSTRRDVTNIAIVLAAVAAILALSLAGASRDQRRLLEDFTAAQRDQGRAAAQTLAARVDALEQNTRMLGDLVERSRGGRELDPTTERRVLGSAFLALANVVDPYRAILFHDGDPQAEVVSADPTEDATTVAFLVGESRALAEGLAAPSFAHGAAQRGARAFFFYGVPVPAEGSVVVTVDVARFLAPASVASGTTRLFLVDPWGETWADCGEPDGCRALAPGEVPPAVRERTRSVTEVKGAGLAGLGLGPAPVVRVVEPVSRRAGTWTVIWLGSTAPLVSREQSLVLRLLGTALAVAAAVLGVGAAILRQQRSALALEGRLELAQALARARQTSEAIVENAPLGVLGVSEDGKVALANRFLGERLGPVKVGAPLEAAFSGDAARWVPELFAPAEGVSAGDRSARSIRPAPAGAPPFDVRIVPVRDPALGVKTFALFEDRSAIRNLENQLVRAEKLITVGVLSAGIAHEIGTPLAVIRGRAEQVLRAVGPGPTEGDLRVIIDHIDRITSTIRRLLDFSRRQPIERRAVSLASALQRASELLQWKLESRRLRLETRIDPGLPPLAADADQLQQVLVNLLMNACDASEPGGCIRLIAARAPSSGAGEELVSVRVIDDGCGIAPEHVHSIFDPFFTTKKRGEGTGLGLTIVSSIVGNHGGKIDVASTHGRGTTITVLWPIHAGPADA